MNPAVLQTPVTTTITTNTVLRQPGTTIRTPAPALTRSLPLTPLLANQFVPSPGHLAALVARDLLLQNPLNHVAVAFPYPGYATPSYGGYGSYPSAGYTMPYHGGYSNSGYGMPNYGANSDPGYGMVAANYSYGGLQTSYGSNPYGAGSGSYSTGAGTYTQGKEGSAAKQGQGSATSKGSPDQAAVTAETSKLLDAIGVPNDKGTVLYPLGLRVLQPQAENLELLDRIETLVQVTASQQKNGQVNANLLQEANTAVERLQQLLRNRQHNMMPDTYAQAEQFVDTLRHGLKVLQPNAAVQ
jgi:hypothetical protein